MDKLLNSLRHRRAAVQDRIEDEQARPRPDHLKLRALKKLRLRFRDKVEFIERMNGRGDTAPIQVVRRRSIRAVNSGTA